MQKKSLLSNILELIIPKLCCACHEKLSSGEKTLCTKCRIELPYTYDWYKKDNPALEILNAYYPVEWAASLGFYRKNDNYSKAILNLKFKNQKQCAIELGEIFANEIIRAKTIPQNIDLIVPTPLHWAKKLWRGYNQSYYIALGISKVLKCPIDEHCVSRAVLNKTQSKTKDRKRRITNVENIFRVKDGDKIDGKHILLVDDVLTTGSTLHSLIKTIFDNCENCKISVATLARTDTQHKGVMQHM